MLSRTSVKYGKLSNFKQNLRLTNNNVRQRRLFTQRRFFRTVPNGKNELQPMSKQELDLANTKLQGLVDRQIIKENPYDILRFQRPNMCLPHHKNILRAIHGQNPSEGGILTKLCGWIWGKEPFDTRAEIPKTSKELLELSQQRGPIVICAAGITSETSSYTSEAIDESNFDDLSAPQKIPHHAIILLASWVTSGGNVHGLFWDGDNTVNSPGLLKAISWCKENNKHIDDMSTEEMNACGGFSAGLYITDVENIVKKAEKASASPPLIMVSPKD